MLGAMARTALRLRQQNCTLGYHMHQPTDRVDAFARQPHDICAASSFDVRSFDLSISDLRPLTLDDEQLQTLY